MERKRSSPGELNHRKEFGCWVEGVSRVFTRLNVWNKYTIPSFDWWIEKREDIKAAGISLLPTMYMTGKNYGL